MNKGIILALALATVFLFTACDSVGTPPSSTTNGNSVPSSSHNPDSTTDTPPAATVGINENEWDAATQTQNFDNVTFTYEATFLSGRDSTVLHTDTLKITENGMIMDNELMTDAATITSAKTMFIDTSVAIVSNFHAFSYDQDNNCYHASGPIVYRTTVLGYEATITAENVTVTFDEHENIATISCRMTQAFEEEGTQITYVLDTKFTFSDYGMTTLAI